MQPFVDDKARLQAMLRAAASPAPGADFLMARAADELASRLALVERRFAAPLTLFCRTAHAAEAIALSGRADAPARRIEQPERLAGGAGFVATPPEAFDIGEQSADLVVSLMALHAVNDLPGFLARVRRALRPDGLFLAALPGAGTLAELRDVLLAADAEAGAASPRVMPFADIRQAGSLLQQAGFALPVVDIDTVTVRYSNLAALMADLRAMGETNALLARRRFLSRRETFARASALYAERHGDADGRIRATFSTIWMSGWAPHPAQPRPARRGSATVSLEKALRDAEGKD